MNPAAATALATRILSTFNVPPLRDWEEELATLDEGRAGTAYARLRREHQHKWLSIAQFLEVYRSVSTVDGGNREDKCGRCDGTGWVETPRHQFRGVAYTGVQPCPYCSEGQRREVSETWTKSPERDFITDAEADRLIQALKETP